MPTEIARIQEAITHNIPYLGVCLGFQTLAKAANGNITRSPRKEVGFRDAYPNGALSSVRLTDEGRSPHYSTVSQIRLGSFIFMGKPSSYPRR